MCLYVAGVCEDFFQVWHVARSAWPCSHAASVPCPGPGALTQGSPRLTPGQFTAPASALHHLPCWATFFLFHEPGKSGKVLDGPSRDGLRSKRLCGEDSCFFFHGALVLVFDSIIAAGRRDEGEHGLLAPTSLRADAVSCAQTRNSSQFTLMAIPTAMVRSLRRGT